VAAFYGVGVNPLTDRLGLGPGLPGIRHSPQSGTESPATALARYEPPVAGFGPRGMHDRSGVVLDAVVERASCELRPAESKGPLNGPPRRPALPGLDASFPARGPQPMNVVGVGERRGEATTRGRFSSITSGWAKTIPIATGTPRVAAGLVDGKFVNLRVPYRWRFYAK